MWPGEGGLDRIILLSPYQYAPTLGLWSFYAVRWSEWYGSEGESGEEPPEATRRQLELYNQVRETPDLDEQLALMKEILKIAKEEFYVMGLSLPAKGYGTVKNNFHNMPESMIAAWLYAPPGPHES